ncbi:ABC transporter permease [Cryptosporangium aurantiacum]|uniref:Nucleoside ABC transporter membrane protein n=1 Tax=Cryptosporangium aurantiacum TaxID=134849 RepID=A0A1M7ML54_9ACTN|nr:ABC transporter permease [Cryptosporangium aurantiacum]SHM91747.1 nucleoside ABC transporter membrane protein [Cryptosporangium aurantiacum]
MSTKRSLPNIAELMRPSERSIQVTLITIVAVSVAVIASMFLVAATGGSPGDAAEALYTGSIADTAAWSETLKAATPLLLVALGACISNRAGVFNIGQEGQLLLGAGVAAYVALHLALPGFLVMVISLLAGAAAGGLWSGASAVMHYTRNVNIVVSTLLMSFLAIQVVSFAVTVPWLLQAPRASADSIASSESAQLPPEVRIPGFGEYPALEIGGGLIVSIVCTIVLAVLLARSRWGFRLNMLGLNPLAARHAGVRAPWLGGFALALSGAFAGLAGAVILSGQVFRLQPALSNNFGWDGLLVALIARSRPLAAIPVALLFGALRSGSSFLASTGVPNYLVDIVQALLVLAFVVPPVVARVRSRGRAEATKPPTEPVPAANTEPEKVTA